jgi:D-3-phosphoglycerate dehydrogenase
MIKCLIIDKIHERIFEILEEANIEVDYEPAITREEIIACVGNYEVLLVRGKTQIDREILEKGTRLRAVARAGAGLDILDVEYLEEKNIKILASPEANRDAVGDQTVGMILSMLSKINQSDKEVKEGIWNREGNRGIEMEHKSIAIIGFGNMGKAVAKRLQGFESTILVHDKYKSGFSEPYIEEASMERVFEEADIVSFHVPLTSETENMVTDAYLERFRKNIYLVNTARGKVVHMAPVVKGLASGKLLGAALDVLECENFDRFTPEQRVNFDLLCASDKTILTPHIGGWSVESYEKISEVLGKKIVDTFQG